MQSGKKPIGSTVCLFLSANRQARCVLANVSLSFFLNRINARCSLLVGKNAFGIAAPVKMSSPPVFTSCAFPIDPLMLKHISLLSASRGSGAGEAASARRVCAMMPRLFKTERSMTDLLFGFDEPRIVSASWFFQTRQTCLPEILSAFVSTSLKAPGTIILAALACWSACLKPPSE